MTPIRKKFFLTLSGFVAVNAVLFGVFGYLLLYKIFPFSEDFLSTEKNIRVAEEKMFEYRRIVEPELKRDIQDIERIQRLFYPLDESRALDFILFLEGLIRRNQAEKISITLPTKEVKTSKETGKQVTAEPTLSFEVSATYPQVIRLLREIENEQFLINVMKVSLMPQGLKVRAQITIALKTP